MYTLLLVDDEEDVIEVIERKVSWEQIGFHVVGHAVSYTHLRAHETDSYLVCRLLLEKKKKI